MPRTIVIGTDGSGQADAALRFGGALARGHGARVIVATAYEHMPTLRGDGGGFERLARSDAQEIADRGAAFIADVADVRSSVAVGGTLAGALHTLAELEHADLLVVAASSRLHVAGRQPRGVTEHVVHHSPCPVAVVPCSDREPAFERIGVALDDSFASRAVLDQALALCVENSRLELVHADAAADLVYAWPGEPVDPQQPEPELGRLHALTTEIGEKASVVTREGGPGEVLVQLSDELDLLVCGSRDQGPIKRLLLGSVSTHVVRHTRCPAVIVPPSVRAHAASQATPTRARA